MKLLLLFLVLLLPLYSQAQVRYLQDKAILNGSYVVFATDELVEGDVTLEEAMALCEANVLRWDWGDSFKNWVYPFWFREDFMTPLEYPMGNVYDGVDEYPLFYEGNMFDYKLNFLSHDTVINTDDVYDESVWVYWGTDINTPIPATTCAQSSTTYHDISLWGNSGIISKFSWSVWWEETPCIEKRRIPCIAKTDGTLPVGLGDTTAVIVFQSINPISFTSPTLGYSVNCEEAREFYEIGGESFVINYGIDGYPYHTQVPVLNPNLEIIAPSLESFFLNEPPHESVCHQSTVVGTSLKPNGMLLPNYTETCLSYRVRDADNVTTYTDLRDPPLPYTITGLHWLKNDCQKPLSQSDPQPCALLGEESLEVYAWCAVLYTGEMDFISPTKSPTQKPTFKTKSPTSTPTSSPTFSPLSPTLSPSTRNPTHSPTNSPTSEDDNINTYPSASPIRPDISTQKGVIVGFTGMFILASFAMLLLI